MARLNVELLAVVLLLSLALFVSSYSDFVVQGKAVSQPEIPDWAGAPWSLFDSASIEEIRINDELVSVRNVVYGADSTSFDVFAKGDYIWSDGWLWDGTQWQQLKFSSDLLQGGSDIYVSTETQQGWISKAAVSRQSMRLSAGRYWLVAYTCQWVNGQWKCGCKTETDCNKWQIQSFDVSDSSGARAKIVSSRSASIRITADDEYELYLNERLVGRGNNWKSYETFDVQLSPGENVISVIAKDAGGEEGLLIDMPEASSDNTWRAKIISDMSEYEKRRWKQPGFDDSEWEVPTENRKKSASKRPLGFVDAKWIWGRTTKAGKLADGYAFRKVINVIDEETKKNAVNAVLNNDIIAIKSLPDPLRKVAVDQYSLNNRDVSNCNAGTEDCIQKTLYFSCTESGNKESCEAEILRQSGIPGKNAFPRLHVDYYGDSQDPKISKERTFLYPNRRLDYCEIEIDWNSDIHGSNRLIEMATSKMRWGFQNRLRDIPLRNIHLVHTGGELRQYYCPSGNENFPCYILDYLRNSNREEYICTGKYWLGCSVENPTNTGITIEGTNYFCGSSGWSMA